MAAGATGAGAGEPAEDGRPRPSLAQRRRVPGRALVARSSGSVPPGPPGSAPPDEPPPDEPPFDDATPDDGPGSPHRASRRRFLLAGAGAVVGVAALGAGGTAAVYEDWLPGRRRLIQGIEGCGTAEAFPQVTPGAVTRTSFHSTARRRDVGLVVAYPPGYAPGTANSGASGSAGPGSAGPGSGASDDGSPVGSALPPLPVVLVLHGLGDQAGSFVDALGAPTYLAAATAGGVPPFALVGVDGGGTYWHRRANGDDPETMIMNEVLPRLAAAGLRTDRFGVLGWSMGGYGALLLAHRHPGRIVAAAASSPAVWRSFAAAAPGAFDSAADFDAHRVLGTGRTAGVTYRIACGNADEFSGVSHRLAGQLTAQRDFSVGCHEFATWRRYLPGHLAFLGAALPT